MIDAEKQTITSVLPAGDGKSSVGAAFSDDGETLYALTYDGRLNALDTHDGEVVAEAPLLETVDWEAAPSFIVVGEFSTSRIQRANMSSNSVLKRWRSSGSGRSTALRQSRIPGVGLR